MKNTVLKAVSRFLKVQKRSFKKNRSMWIRGAVLALFLLVILLFVRGCACGSKRPKETDEASQGVMTITVAPSPTPTDAPRQVDSSATAKNGNLTMINEYLVQKNSGTSDLDAASEGRDEAEPEEQDDQGDGQ